MFRTLQLVASFLVTIIALIFILVVAGVVNFSDISNGLGRILGIAGIIVVSTGLIIAISSLNKKDQ